MARTIKKGWPAWALKTPVLRKWQKVQGVFLIGPCLAHVLFVDAGQPLGIALLRPVRLNRENKAITGSFILEAGEERLFAVGRYSPCLKAFVLRASLEQLDFARRHSWLVKYIDSQDRERLQESLGQHEREETWQPEQRRGSLLEPSPLERIFSSPAKAAAPAKVFSPQP